MGRFPDNFVKSVLPRKMSYKTLQKHVAPYARTLQPQYTSAGQKRGGILRPPRHHRFREGGHVVLRRQAPSVIIMHFPREYRMMRSGGRGKDL